MQLTARCAAVLVCLLGVASEVCGQAPQEADARLVREVAVGIISADNARDLTRVLSFYADDAILMPPNEASVRGKAAIRPRYERLFADFNPEITGEIEELQVADDWAFVRGVNRGSLAPRAGGEARQLSDVYLMILRRATAGSWQIARLIWHPGAAPTHEGRELP